MNYNPNDRSYYHTKKNKNIIMVYPLTKLAEQELKASKQTLLPFYQFILSNASQSKSFEKSLAKDISSLKKEEYLLINQDNIKMVQDILEDSFFSERFDEIGIQKVDQNVELSYKIATYFMKNLLSI